MTFTYYGVEGLRRARPVVHELPRHASNADGRIYAVNEKDDTSGHVFGAKRTHVPTGKASNKAMLPSFTAKSSSNVRQLLEDGSEVEVIWSWLSETKRAKLVSVYFPE
ncbi:MAG: hypothetical protein L0Y70_07630 [Gemmataceae bacterium]|nr:hypothetical protein [Gemmataceae bacterium]